MENVEGSWDLYFDSINTWNKWMIIFFFKRQIFDCVIENNIYNYTDWHPSLHTWHFQSQNESNPQVVIKPYDTKTPY